MNEFIVSGFKGIRKDYVSITMLERDFTHLCVATFGIHTFSNRPEMCRIYFKLHTTPREFAPFYRRPREQIM